MAFKLLNSLLLLLIEQKLYSCCVHAKFYLKYITWNIMLCSKERLRGLTVAWLLPLATKAKANCVELFHVTQGYIIATELVMNKATKAQATKTSISLQKMRYAGQYEFTGDSVFTQHDSYVFGCTSYSVYLCLS